MKNSISIKRNPIFKIQFSFSINILAWIEKFNFKEHVKEIMRKAKMKLLVCVLDCPVRLACKYCFKESFHQNHELQIFDVIGVKNVSFEEYNKLEIQERIAKQRKLFNCAKAKLIETINLLEIDFQKDIKRLEEIDNIIQNSIKMVETKNLSTFTEQHAQIIVNLHNNNISPQMDQMTSLPIINQFEELNIQLQSRLKFINIEQFLKKHCKDPRLIQFYNIRQCDYEQTPPDLKWIYKKGNLYFGGVVNGLQEGRGISIDKNGHQILEGIWSKGQLKWGQKAEINSVNLAQMQTGEFINKEIQGKGSARWSDGDKWSDVGEIYEGNFIEGKREGVGKLQWPDGEIYEGEWQNDRKEGKGCYKWKKW